MYSSEATFRFLRGLFSLLGDPLAGTELVCRAVLPRLESPHGQESPQVGSGLELVCS